jgi:hypothetical protein
MSNKFGRQYELVVRFSQDEAILVKPPIRIQFSGTKSIDRGLNKMNVSIYNLSESKRRKLTKDEDEKYEYLQIILRVGYDEIQTVFQGNINKAYSSKQGTDFVTTLECLDGGRDYLFSFTSRTVRGKDNSLNAILEDMPNTNKGKITAQNQLIRAKVLVGSSSKLIEEQLLENEKFFIDEEKIYILKDDEMVGEEAAVISPETGLLGMPSKEKDIVTADVLMDPNVKIARPAKLESKYAPNMNGIYRVEKIDYKGDYDGNDWSMSVEMKIANNFKEI